MKKIGIFIFLGLMLSGCWGVAPQPFPIQSPIPSPTPGVVTATPLIIPPPNLDITQTPSLTILTQISPTNTETPPPTLTETVPPIQTDTPLSVQSVSVDILGCNTSIDILNGMGEVTNAYVTIKNTGTVDIPNACGLLRAIDEGRPHPDKKRCVNNLPTQNQVTLKLTVDSTYKEDTIIQVDVLSNDVTLLRVDKQSCRDISLFGGQPADTGVVKPIP